MKSPISPAALRTPTLTLSAAHAGAVDRSAKTETRIRPVVLNKVLPPACPPWRRPVREHSGMADGRKHPHRAGEAFRRQSRHRNRFTRELASELIYLHRAN